MCSASSSCQPAPPPRGRLSKVLTLAARDVTVAVSSATLVVAVSLFEEAVRASVTQPAREFFINVTVAASCSIFSDPEFVARNLINSEEMAG